MKRCSKCGEEKDESEFHRCTKSSSGRKRECKACAAARNVAYIAGLSPEKVAALRARSNAANKKWFAANQPGSKYVQRWAAKNPERAAVVKARANLKQLWGFAPPEEVVLLKAQQYLIMWQIKEMSK